jgi:hypothetical protein
LPLPLASGRPGHPDHPIPSAEYQFCSCSPPPQVLDGLRWNRAVVQPLLDVRTAVLNDTLKDAFRRRYPGFRPANDDEAVALAA